jgi:LacI family transcriptional regulator
MPTTLADIARELGISKMTVSRAINNHPEINTETRERVLELARRMNYHPNQHARALATNRSYLFGLIVPDLMHSYYAELLRSIESVARPAGFQIVVFNTEEDAARERDEVEVLLHCTDGLIIASALPPEDTKQYGKMIKDGARIVLIDRELRNLRCPMVTTDNVQVGKLAATHLIGLGHRRIGHLLGNETVVGLERFEGYKQALAEHQLPFEDSLVRKCGFLEEGGFEAMRAWIAGGDYPRAIFAANDPAAIGAMRAVEDAGLRVGLDVALIGAGNIHHGDMLRVPLSTVSWSRAEMGQAAATVLIKLIDGALNGTKAAQRILIKPELLIRQSCGATRHSKARAFAQQD